MNIKEDYKKEKISFIEDVEENKVDTKKDHPKNIFELEKAIQEYKNISYQDEKTDPNLKDRKNTLYSYIARGIPVNDIPLKDEIIEKISTYLGGFGYSKEYIKCKLENITVYTTSLGLIMKEGAVGLQELKRIGIDYSYFEFDPITGEFTGKIKDTEFLKHIITHELFHILSLEKNKNAATREDTFSEGFTDLFATMVNGTFDKGSNTYNFSTRVCTLFAGILGMNKVLDDYINGIDTLPNITKLCEECGVSETRFIKIRQLLSLSITKFDLPPNDVLVLEVQRNCLEVLKNEIINPYCLLHPNEADRITLFFEELFKDYFLRIEGNKKL